MLLLIKKMRDIRFSQLMEVYEEGNRENGADLYPQETPERQLALAEADFYDYLSQVFFPTPGAVYALWEAEGKYVSALRLEPFRDGVLLEALETRPDSRRKGYAAALIKAVQAQLGETKIYSHVSRRNIPSMRTHIACGFQKYLDYAVYADGSVRQDTVTMRYPELGKDDF